MSHVALLPHDPAWPAQFDQVQASLRAAFADATVAIEHIGSTAVPGLAAKPVIDVLVGATSLALIEHAIPALRAAGYDYVARHESVLPERRYFKHAGDGDPPVHVHAVVVGSPFWLRHLAFRDALRADAGLVRRYAELKQALAERFAQDGTAYADAKTSFIDAVIGPR